MTIGGLLSFLSENLSCSNIAFRSHAKTLSSDTFSCSLVTLIPSSIPRRFAVSKSSQVLIPPMILLLSIHFNISWNGSPDFSENSLTVIVSLIVIDAFFVNVSDTHISLITLFAAVASHFATGAS